ncbi:MAG: hypothetical protein CMK52_00040 [Proteobacteria bacterium]|nr:hypothetical protein [Pseudomonadota bacterium]|tara:strand:- start:858 stop:1256 length:399 start_codon:yes stop_codon:yes gene_type:complete
MMKYFFLVCHKPLGSSLQKCVEFSIGKSIEEIINIEITPDDNLPEIRNLIEHAWYKCGRPEEIFVFSDLKGATPCNGLFSWLEGKRIIYKGVTGVNLPMLVCAINHKNLSLDLLLEKVLEAKDKGIQSLDIY